MRAICRAVFCLPICFLCAVGTAVPSVAGGWPISTPGTLLVMNKSDNTATLVALDSGKTLATLPTGTEPHEGAASADGRLVVISNTDYNSNRGHTLTVIDVPARKVAATIALGDLANPHGIVFLPDGRVIVTVEGSEALAIVDVAERAVARVIRTPGYPCHMVATSPDGARAYATSISRGALVVLDLDKGEMLRAVATGDGAEGFDLAGGGGEIWIGNRGADTISIVDAATLEVTATVEAPGFPIRVRASLDGARVLVSGYRAGAVMVFDREARALAGRIEMEGDAAPIGILVAPDGRHAFIANTRSNIVTVIDLREMEVAATLRAGKTPDGMALAVTPGSASP
jgi:YVTN family beta-propeller protein